MIFSLRNTSPANQILQAFGLPAQQWLRDPRGIFEIMAQAAGGNNVRLPDFLVGPSLPLLSAIIYGIWVFSGYNAVIFLAGLGNIPKEMYEAAQVDGAGRWETFRSIIFPLISPITFFLTLLAVVGTFRAFQHIYVLRTESARGAMDTTTVYIYEIIRTVGKPRPYAAALSLVLFGIILILTIIQNRLSRDRVFYG
jgi:multiple sugar transport system permease protein